MAPCGYKSPINGHEEYFYHRVQPYLCGVDKKSTQQVQLNQFLGEAFREKKFSEEWPASTKRFSHIFRK